MLLKFLCSLTLVAGFLFVSGANDGIPANQEGEVKVDLKDVKCFMMPAKGAKESNAVKYLDGNVYFCCGNCVKKFSADKEKFSTKANHQLALTGQYKQTGCPISGGDVDPDQVSEIGGVKVAFCCENCKGKVDAAEGLEAKAEMVFAMATFEKNFASKKKSDDEMDVSKAKCPIAGKEVNVSTATDFNGGKVYFCCGNCASKFSAENETHVAKANQQLVATGQFSQKGCPMSGGKLNAEQTVSVGGTEVAFCCGGCKAKAEGAESDDARVQMLFNKDAFAKGFVKK